MKLLFDTHALIWWFEGSVKFSPKARDVIDEGGGTLLVSVVSAFEMTTKHRLGKLNQVTELLDHLPNYLDRQGFEILPLSLAHAELGGKLPFDHRDPFDRLLIAQAQIEQAILVSNETLFDSFGVRRLW
jgi:PIN domain nuclease of toxin-antitoxin system